MSKLLIEEPPLQVLPSLATAIGLNEAIAVQQVHYWMTGKSGKMFEGKRWIYNSYPKWQEQFPFWSKATIQRTFASAEAKGILISRQEKGYNRQKHYTIDYDALESSMIAKCDDGQPQFDTVTSSQVDTVLTEIETTTETEPVVKVKKERERNPVFDAIASVCGPDDPILLEQYIKGNGSWIAKTSNNGASHFSPEKIKEWYGSEGWYYTVYCKGLVNAPKVSPSQIQKTIALAAEWDTKPKGKGNHSSELKYV